MSASLVKTQINYVFVTVSIRKSTTWSLVLVCSNCISFFVTYSRVNWQPTPYSEISMSTYLINQILNVSIKWSILIHNSSNSDDNSTKNCGTKKKCRVLALNWLHCEIQWPYEFHSSPIVQTMHTYGWHQHKGCEKPTELKWCLFSLLTWSSSDWDFGRLWC